MGLLDEYGDMKSKEGYKIITEALLKSGEIPEDIAKKTEADLEKILEIKNKL